MVLSKDEREAGYRSVPQPSPEQVAVLRRVASGYLTVTRGTDEKGRPSVEYTYDDGAQMTLLGKIGADQERAVTWMVACGWLISIPNEALPLIEGEAGQPQRYRVRTLADGPLPKWIDPPQRSRYGR